LWGGGGPWHSFRWSQYISNTSYPILFYHRLLVFQSNSLLNSSLVRLPCLLSKKWKHTEMVTSVRPSVRALRRASNSKRARIFMKSHM
jgi:hypothetical protein